ncbi:hypothetical protein QQS21_008982 [Conoideocrella luteorostrata]|uniref:Methyltransferase domain-containing protein n=1 Tax=Conoideocrella luteorostrata TaxID=1105319 RepID=A0AAJ0CHS9_9HYPO|nr:hypothetical protein QQS21_008982 [Conoideocrella luteorostrata]
MASNQHNSYGPGHAIPHVKHHEWRTAENSATHLIAHLQSGAAQNPKVRVLDVGAGSGTITASLAKYIPEGHIVATDISDDILKRAKFHVDKEGIKNISYQKASVYELPFANSSFDITHAHQVLTHLDAPVDAIREMLRVTKPGGIVSLREVDMAMWCWWPELPALQLFHETLVKSMVDNGGSGNAGRQLLSWSMKADVPRENIEMTFGTWCHCLPEDRESMADSMIERLRFGPMRVRAIERGIATEKDIDSMMEAWEKWKVTEDAVLGQTSGEAIIRKA